MNKANSNARDILDAFPNFTVIVVFVAASWLQEYKAKGCILEVLRASCSQRVQDSYIAVGNKIGLSLACCLWHSSEQAEVWGLVLGDFFFSFKVSESTFLAPVVALKSYENDLC